MNTMTQTAILSDHDKKLLIEMKNCILDICPNAEVLLYGSVARGTQTPDSDYDILILTDTPLSKNARRDIETRVLDLELAHDVILSTIYHSKEEWRLRADLPFYCEVEKHGLAL